MKDGRCPMCNSTEVYANQAVRFFSSNARVYLRDEDGIESPKSGAVFVPYVCVNCGFTAMFVKDLEAVQSLPKAKDWKKVGG